MSELDLEEPIIGVEGQNVIAFIGNQGTGKTLLLTAALCWELEHGREAFATYHISYKATDGRAVHFVDFGKLITLLEAEDKKFPLGTAVMAIDEAYLGLDSRESGTIANKYLTSRLFQARKMGFDIYYAAQLNSRIDKSLRNITGLKIVCDKVLVPWKKDPKKLVPEFNYYLLDPLEDELSTALKGHFTIDYELFLQIYPYYDTQERVRETEMQLGKEEARAAVKKVANQFKDSVEADMVKKSGKPMKIKLSDFTKKKLKVQME